ncbi:multidrug effflux MFS transporter [Pseudomonas sp. JZ134]|uniref:multidrug effflux MFS transporter n=1 Tax=Pseudomonas sp. JZ134 TaxID=2806615 RepID=UPI003D9FD90C
MQTTTTSIPRYPVMVLILGALACIGPMSIDAYLPAFGAIGRDFQLTPEKTQLTLGLYMLAFAFMTLLHGTLSDSFGRRRVILSALAVYIAGSLIAALGPSFDWLLAGRVCQGLSAGAGMVVGQAIVTDCYKGPVAQKTMSYIIMVFSVSPAFAPIIGGYLSEHTGWRGVFFFLAALAVFSASLCAFLMPETLAPERRQAFDLSVLSRNYGRVMRDGQFMARAVVFGALFGGFAFLIGAAPDFVTQVLGLAETDFGYLFIPIVIGLTSGSFLAARLSSQLPSGRLIGFAYAMLGLSCLINLTYTGLATDLNVYAAVIPARAVRLRPVAGHSYHDATHPRTRTGAVRHRRVSPGVCPDDLLFHRQRLACTAGVRQRLPPGRGPVHWSRGKWLGLGAGHASFLIGRARLNAVMSFRAGHLNSQPASLFTAPLTLS